MNASIARLFGFVVLLFALLTLFTSRWTVFDATALNNNSLNARPVLQERTIKRGRIFADNGEVLAESVPAPGGTWTRRYPTGSLFAQAIGYFNAVEGQTAGLERHQSSELDGTSSSGLASIFGTLDTSGQVGDDVYTTLDPTAQQVAVSELAGRPGAVVALDPRTGAVKVLYANPTYNDNAPNAPGGTQFDAALQSVGLPPGSTFKIVTTTAALDTGTYTPDSIINGNSPIIESGVTLANDADKSWGPITLTEALTNSVNTVFAQVGEKLGVDTMATYMKRFGFYSTPPLDFPADEMAASGERGPNGHLLSPTSNLIDVGRMAIGQDKLAVTPLQMAMVTAAVANGGKLMAPHLTAKVVNPDGIPVQTITPSVYNQVMKSSVASEVTAMMTDVVEEGTGTAANLEGVQVAGKTGTAQVGPPSSDLDDPWFIGFAPVVHPRVAVAVALESIPNGYGGVYAAPIAAQVIKTLLAEGQ
ncbi:MAG: peptidoglycan D,D-transpeptidase FtsI family protein [Solirubrobacteraceae bacterium]